MDLGERLKTERALRHWSQYDLARASGVSQSAIAKIESGTRRRISGDILQKLATAFGMSLDTLTTGTPSPDLSQPPIEAARAIGIPQADLDLLQRRWPAWSEARKRDYLRQVETAQRQQAQLRALTEDDEPGAPTQTQILAGVS